MSYRFVRVTNNYREYIESFYQRFPNVNLLSYAEQYQQLVQDSIEISSAYVKNFNKIGVEAYEIITNAHVLQDTWRKEHNVVNDVSEKDLVIQQVKYYQPDVVWIDDLGLVEEEWKSKLLKEVPTIKLFVGHHCAPYSDDLLQRLKLLDIVFTCTPGLKNEFEQHGLKSHLLYHGFEESVLDNVRENNTKEELDFVFTGSLISGAGFHKTRIEYIEAILKSGIKMDLFGNLESRKKLMIKKVFYHLIVTLRKIGLGKLIETIPLLKKNKAFGDTPINFYSKELMNSSRPPVFGLEMYKVLSKANICFNIHGDVAGNCAGNIRLFEATGVGSCLVTDWKDNITTLFEPDKEIITYKTKEECIEKVKWLIANPEERKKIAEAGQRKTLQKHTIGKRVKGLNELFKQALEIK